MASLQTINLDLTELILSLLDRAAIGAIAQLSIQLHKFFCERDGTNETFLNILTHYASNLYSNIEKTMRLGKTIIPIKMNLLAEYKLRCLVPPTLCVNTHEPRNIFFESDLDEIKSMHARGVCMKIVLPPDHPLIDPTKHLDAVLDNVIHGRKKESQGIDFCVCAKASCGREYNMSNPIFVQLDLNKKQADRSALSKSIHALSIQKAKSKFKINNFTNVHFLSQIYNSGVCLNMQFDSDVCSICQMTITPTNNHLDCLKEFFDTDQHRLSNKNCRSISPCTCSNPSNLFDYVEKYIDICTK